MDNPITPAMVQSAARWVFALAVGWFVAADKAETFINSTEGQALLNGLVLIAGAAVSLGWSYLTQRKLLNTEPPK